MELEEIIKSISASISPDKGEREKIIGIAEKFKGKVSEIASKYLDKYEVFLGGSVAKDTWISGEADVDIFLLMPPSITRAEFEKIGLKVAEEALKDYKRIRRFAEHPYLEADVDGVKVSVVPAYKTSKGAWLSSVDRTPYHVEYVNRKLRDERLRNDVRLLKKLMKGIGTYGAEVAVKGFSGYLCELLVVHSGGFKELVREVAYKWRKPVVIDLENQYRGDLETILRMFRNNPLIVVDPVDQFRNVAAAVSEKTLVLFISACRSLLRTPSRKFFFPEKRKLELKRELGRHGEIIAVVLKHGEAVEDILFPQLERLSRKLTTKLSEKGFKPIRFKPYSDFTSRSAIFIELESLRIPEYYLHKGPSAFNSLHEESFLRKNVGEGYFVWIDEDGLWKAVKRRRILNVSNATKQILKDGNIIPKSLKSELEGIEVKSLREIVESDELKVFLEDFLTISEFWVEEFE